MPRKYGVMDDVSVDFCLDQIKRWLLIRNSAEDRQLSIDIDHSALLRRLLKCEEPLPYPPPRAYSYPWYSLIDNGWAETSDVYMHETEVNVCQSRWRMLEKINDHIWRIQNDAGPTVCILTEHGKMWKLVVESFGPQESK